MKKLLLIALLGLSLTYIGKAQSAPGFGDDTEDTNPNNNNAPGFDDDVNDVPVDGGIGLLVGAGVVYGINKFRRHNQISKEKVTSKV